MARLDEILETLSQFVNPKVVETVGAFADAALQECALCNRRAIPFPCKLCGVQVCHEHGFHKLGTKEAICDLCFREIMGAAAGIEHEEDFDHWAYLDLPGPVKRQLVERAFRLKSRTCHPDYFPGDSAKAQEWRRLQVARERALEELESRGMR